MSNVANTYQPAANWRNRDEAHRFNEALARVHREIGRCAALFDIEHRPNPAVTALLL
jgi:hypothetical protein